MNLYYLVFMVLMLCEILLMVEEYGAQFREP